MPNTIRRSFSRYFLFSWALLGCGVSKPSEVADAGAEDADGADIAVGSDAGTPYPAIHPPIPLAIHHGGRVLTAPSIFTVTFAGDPFESTVRAFDDAITQKPWWTAATAEYCNPKAPTECVGPGKSAGHATLGAADATYSDADVQALVQSHIADGTFPTPTDQSVYAIYFPLGTTITSFGETSCQDFHAYHYFMNATPPDAGAPVSVTYVVISRCSDSNSDLAMTLLASHELAETATDPIYPTGYAVDDVNWSLASGGEVADLCLNSSFGYEGSWAVEHVFSNAAAAKGKNPCVPTNGEPDFNVAPPNGDASLVLMKGETKTLQLTAYSDAPVDDWTIDVAEHGSSSLAFALDRTTVNNGASVSLQIKLLQVPPDGKAAFVIRSTNGSSKHFWPGVVMWH